MSYVVTAPYVTMRAKDNNGADVLRGFYAGAVLTDEVNADDLEKHVRKDMVAEQGTPKADAASPAGQPVQFDDLGVPLSPADAAAAEAKRAARSARPGPRAAEPKPRPAEAKG